MKNPFKNPHPPKCCNSIGATRFGFIAPLDIEMKKRPFIDGYREGLAV